MFYCTLQLWGRNDFNSLFCEKFHVCKSNHRKNEQSVTPLTSEIHHSPTPADADLARDRFPDVWHLSLQLFSQAESFACSESLSRFFFSPARSALDMPEMFTRAMKVGTLYLCYKQIFPFLATAVNGLRTSTSPRPSAGKLGICMRSGNADQTAQEHMAAIWSHPMINQWRFGLPFDIFKEIIITAVCFFPWSTFRGAITRGRTSG